MDASARIHILRHGQSLHNILRGYPGRDPPLTEHGCRQATNFVPPAEPDLILASPMTRTLQTASIVFRELLASAHTKVELQIWPDLREAHDAKCNQGVSRAVMAAKFPKFDFSGCPEEWDYPPNTFEDATARAERVRERLKTLSPSYKNIFLVTHCRFIRFLVQGGRFDVCECRSYRFAAEEEIEDARNSVSWDTGENHDFGPSLLLPLSQMSVQ